MCVLESVSSNKAINIMCARKIAAYLWYPCPCHSLKKNQHNMWTAPSCLRSFCISWPQLKPWQQCLKARMDGFICCLRLLGLRRPDVDTHISVPTTSLLGDRVAFFWLIGLHGFPGASSSTLQLCPKTHKKVGGKMGTRKNIVRLPTGAFVCPRPQNTYLPQVPKKN